VSRSSRSSETAEGWEKNQLQHYLKSITYGFTNPMPTSESGVYMVTAANILNGRIDYSNCRHTTVEAYQKLITNKSRPNENDLLLTKDGTLGRLAIVDKQRICVNQSVAVLAINGKADVNFLKHLLEAEEYQRRMLEDAGGSTIRHIYITIVDKMEVSIPKSKQEQNAIAKALSDTDALIASLTKLIEKKRAIKTATMQQLLTGKTRLPGFGEGKGYKDSDLGRIPEDWNILTLNDICIPGGIVRGPFGGSLKKSMFVTTGYSVYEQRHAIEGTVDLTRYYVSESKYSELSRFAILPGVLIVSCAGTIGRIFEIPENAPRGIINQALLKLELSRKEVNKNYFLQLFRSTYTQDKIVDNTQGGAMQNLVGMDIFKNTQFLLPEFDEQAAISEVLTSMDVSIEYCESKLQKTLDVKKTMMQQLLTGRTRLI